MVQLDGCSKKDNLTGAVDHLWNGPSADSSQLQRDLAAYGMDESMLPAHYRQPRHYEIWPEHEAVVQLFVRCSTQWRSSANGLIGLDYGVVLALMDLYAVEERTTVLEDLQIMEAHALELMDRRARREEAKARAAGGRR